MKTFPILRFLGILFLFISCSTTKDGIQQDNGKIEIQLLQLNDVYEIAPLEGGRVGGMARVAQIRKELLEKNPNTYTILAGDFLNPSVIATLQYQNERIRLELLRSAENNDIYFSGPVRLVEGGLGVIGLLPFDKNGEDFKISAVIIYLDTFLDQTQMSAFSDRYYYQFSKVNLVTGEEEFFIENETDHDHPIDWSQQQYVQIPEGDWKLYAHRISTNQIPAYIILLSIFRSGICIF